MHCPVTWWFCVVHKQFSLPCELVPRSFPLSSNHRTTKFIALSSHFHRKALARIEFHLQTQLTQLLLPTMNNLNFSNSSALAALLHALLSAFYEAAIMTIIKIDSFLLPLWMSTIISIDKAIATTTGLFTSGVGPAFRLSTNFGKALRWLAEQLLPTTTTTTTPEEESNITQETLDFLESRIRYLGNFFDATTASMTTTAKPPSSPKRDHSATSSFNNTSSTPVRHTAVRSQACSAQDYVLDMAPSDWDSEDDGA